MVHLYRDKAKSYVIVLSIATIIVSVGYGLLTRVIQPNVIVVTTSGSVEGWLNQARAKYKDFWRHQHRLVRKDLKFWFEWPQRYAKRKEIEDEMEAQLKSMEDNLRQELGAESLAIYDQIKKENRLINEVEKLRDDLEMASFYKMMMEHRKNEIRRLLSIKKAIEEKMK